MASAWEELTKSEHDSIWSAFENRFQFRPSVEQSNWPGIHEPEDSITYSIGHVYNESRYERLTTDLCRKVVSAFRKTIVRPARVAVLDWQHTSYWFDPHEAFQFVSEDDWPVPPLPNGDYYIFLASDLNHGFFGHPWEQTLCVFGEPMLAAFAEFKPLLIDRAVRRGGRAVDE
jgi:hypothetical protein